MRGVLFDMGVDHDVDGGDELGWFIGLIADVCGCGLPGLGFAAFSQKSWP